MLSTYYFYNKIPHIVKIKHSILINVYFTNFTYTNYMYYFVMIKAK